MYEWVSNLHRVYQQRVVGQTKLPGKTLSVGNITWGGTGKTQFVQWLLQMQPVTTAVLSRGYKGGDEARFYWNKGLVCGMGKNRVLAAREVLRNNPGITHWVLDDGFQHWKVERDLDVIMIDCLQPFGTTGRMIPFGSLRERPEVGLKRASLIVLHNANLVHNARELKTTMAQFTPVPIIFSESEPRTIQQQQQHCNKLEVAFAGIGNNEAFFKLLQRDKDRLGELHCVSFPDHHDFSPKDIANLVALNAARYLTTEKDLARMPALAGSPLFAQAVEVNWTPMMDMNNGGDWERFHHTIQAFLKSV
ncbi:tetraacyldisaccharide 4'-kinase [Batrachochytrium salamandrivorans]|nr:tetraacyldisaccharide 4'-kinase [Batrachochytrium salamandrivorans]